MLLVAATLAIFLTGCGEPRERTATTSATRTSPAYDVLDASHSPSTATQQVDPANAAATGATLLASAYAPRPARQPAVVEKPKGDSSSGARDALSSYELVGTGIDGTNAFAVVRTPDRGAVTVREGGVIGRYTVRAIRPDRIRLKAYDQKEAMLVIGVSGSAEEPSASTTDMTPSEANAVSAFLAAGINTDQSIPAHVEYGPTAGWPDGAKHVH